MRAEGRLAKIRAHVVSRQSCAAVAKDLDLVRFLLEQAQDIPGAELDRISRSRNVLAALLEAAIAAVYLEHGFERVERAVVEAFDARIEFALTGHIDNKTELQEALARTGNTVQYKVIEVEGPPHDRRFACAVLIAGEQCRHRQGLDEEGGRAGSRAPGARGDGPRLVRRRKFASADRRRADDSCADAKSAARIWGRTWRETPSSRARGLPPVRACARTGSRMQLRPRAR